MEERGAAGGSFEEGATRPEEPGHGYDPVMVEAARERLRGEQSLGAAAGAGVVAALIGAAAWAAVSIATGSHVGFLAIGVGFLVGFAVRWAGKGLDPAFGLLGGALALAGCVLGNLLMGCWFFAEAQEVPFLEVLANLDPETAWSFLVALFRPMDLLFYGFAAWEGYRLSFRQITAEDLEEPVLSGGSLEPR